MKRAQGVPPSVILVTPQTRLALLHQTGIAWRDLRGAYCGREESLAHDELADLVRLASQLRGI